MAVEQHTATHSDHCRQKGRLAVVLLHLLHLLQAGILGKAIGSAIAPPYLLCRRLAALWLGGPFWASFLGLLSKVGVFLLLQRDGRPYEENAMVDVPEREDLVITVTRERTSDESRSWAERVTQAEWTSHNAENLRPSYPNHLTSEIMAFDGALPEQSLGELYANDQQRLLRLNVVLSRPCSARFTLANHSLDSRFILDKVISMGIPKTQVACIQRSRTGQVNITFTKAELRDLFLSKVATTFEQRPTVSRLAWKPGTFVTVRDAPWELSDKLNQHRLERFGIVHSIRRAFNQSLLPERIPDGRRVLRMTVEEPIPPLMRFGPFLVRFYYTNQPRVCWKCGSLDHHVRIIIALTATSLAMSPTHVKNALDVHHAKQKTTSRLIVQETGGAARARNGPLTELRNHQKSSRTFHSTNRNPSARTGTLRKHTRTTQKVMKVRMTTSTTEKRAERRG